MERAVYWDQIAVGTMVYDVNGEKLGRVILVDPQGQYLQVEKGALFIEDFSIPATAIARVTADGVHLTLSQNDMGEAHYEMLPGIGTTTVYLQPGDGAGREHQAGNRQEGVPGDTRD